jgi:predicted nuclease with TOPRIM domain
MPCTKTLCRVTVIGGLATGALVLLAGPQRVGMLFDQARTAVSERIDDQIQDPVALRNQLRQLEKQYPERIAEVEGELAQLSQEMAQLERDRAVSARVVELAQADLDELAPMIEEAQAARSSSPSAVIRVHWAGQPLSYENAMTRAANIRSTYNAYAARVVEADQTLEVLSTQHARLSDVLGEMQNEFSTFRVQIAELDGQIAAIERNERLIKMVEEREKAIAQLDRHESHSLEHIKGKLAKTRAEQEARLNAALTNSDGDDYAREAEEMLRREAAAKATFDEAMSKPLPVLNDRIDIVPDAEDDDDSLSHGPVASRSVIDID